MAKLSQEWIADLDARCPKPPSPLAAKLLCFADRLDMQASGSVELEARCRAAAAEGADDAPDLLNAADKMRDNATLLACHPDILRSHAQRV